jgi:nitrogen fixation NifU-like protein
MALDELDDLYDASILDHCRHPRNSDRLDSPDASGQAINPFCGDEVDLQLELDGDLVSRVGVQGRGCSINQAAASMLSEAVAGKTLAETGEIAELFRAMMRGDAVSVADAKRIGELTSLQGVLAFPVRVKCALLAWSALEDAVESLDVS